MARIALNALSAQGGGGITGFVNLLPNLCKLDQRNHYFVFVSSRQQEILNAVPDIFRKVIVDYIPSNGYFRILWEQAILPFYLLFLRIDVLYSVGNTTSLAAPCKIVLLIENSNPYCCSNIEWDKKEVIRNALLRYLGWCSAKRANRIRFVSDTSKNILAKRLKLAPDKCVTIYHGFSYRPLRNEIRQRASDSGGSFILTVGAVLPHKNTERLVEAFGFLVKKYGYAGNLIVVGDYSYSHYFEKIQVMVKKLDLSDRILFRGSIHPNDLEYYYLHADIFVFPSLAETFGFPVVEAMAYGVPTVASGNSIGCGDYFLPFKEICQEAAHYVNPTDPAEIAHGIQKVISDKDYRARLISDGIRRARDFSWEKTAESLVEIFNDIGRTRTRFTKNWICI